MTSCKDHLIRLRYYYFGRVIELGTQNILYAKFQIDRVYGSWDIADCILKLMTLQKVGMA